ncbi:hypothetical protein [Oryzomonas rubra]|uniref:Uncharacterized protein n=1 Tax=Oryzomonas rubra TaxID=2509454 RepID=A0A5A9X938_9BACT|nr:hypothetical protein [Oryzomonas rubra]KAA0888719.1 hypothetical protein ET418_15170 [Oryzomonas rubra]
MAYQLRTWPVEEERKCGKRTWWQPARPLPFRTGIVGFFRFLPLRLKITWRVFSGRYDAVSWTESGDGSPRRTSSGNASVTDNEAIKQRVGAFMSTADDPRVIISDLYASLVRTEHALEAAISNTDGATKI